MKRFFKLVSMFVLAGATLTYTGCTDYDKDIDNLGQEVDALEGRLATLEQQVKNLESLKSQLETLKNTHDADVERLDKAIGAVNEALKGYATREWAGQTFVTKTGLQEAITALGTMATKAEVKVALDSAKAALGNVRSLKNALGAYASEGAIQAALDGKLDAAQFNAKFDAALAEALKDGGKISKAIADAIDAATAEFAAMFYGELRSLVFIPDLYVGGIEATEYEYAKYNAKEIKGIEEGKDQQGVDFKTVDPVTVSNIAGEKGKKTIDPTRVVSYEMNPSSADVDAKDLVFLTKDVETRAASAIEVKGIEKKDGNLLVSYTADDSKISTVADKATIFALQATVKSGDKDTTVTSDYARLAATSIEFKNIAFNTPMYEAAGVCSDVTGHHHLYESATKALQNAPSIRVAWDKTFNLGEILEIHYGGAKHATYDMEKNLYGLSYEFKLVDYISGDNKTSDSQFASINAETGVIDPCATNGGERVPGDNDITSVGKRPLVQVLVKKGTDIVLVGYVNVEIVRQADAITTAAFEFTNKFDCKPVDNVTVWHEMVDKILEKAKLSKEEFEKLYAIEKASGNIAQQYQYDATKKTFSVVPAKYLGVVTEITDLTGTTTTVLNWNLSVSDLARVYNEEGHTYRIYVRYTIGGKPATSIYDGIYVPLDVTVERATGNVTVKISEYWFNNGTSAFLNTNIPVEGVNAGTYPWIVDLNNVYEGNLPKFNPTAGYTAFTDNIFKTLNGANGGYVYYFAAEQPKYVIDGETYQLFVKNTKAVDILGEERTADESKYMLKYNAGVYTNDKLYVKVGSDEYPVATITMTGGVPKIWYASNEVSRILLNNYASQPKRTENALYYANIGLAAYSTCGVVMPLSNGINKYHFLRPINPVFATGKNFVDAAEVNAPESNIDIFDIVDFVDWRNVSFSDNIYYYGFYDVNNVNIDIANVTTDLNGGELGKTKLIDKTANIKLTLKRSGTVAPAAGLNITYGTSYTAEDVKNALGTINYQNNGSTVREKFTLRIPVTITYTWGTISDYVDVTVNPSMGA